MMQIAAPLVAGAILGALLATLPDLVLDLLHASRVRRAERAVVRAAEELLRAGVQAP